MKKKLISIVIPLLNEEKNIPLMYTALCDMWHKLPAYDAEFIFVNDGSTDGSASAAAALAAADPRVKYIEFSRNFGKEMATTAGIRASCGEAVIMIDADLQHPPALIPEFVSQWEKGVEVVVGVRTKNHGDRSVTRIGSALFYRIMSLISDAEMLHGETDFRLIDRVVADAFNSLPEHNRMTRSLINWLGFRKEVIEFEAPARVNGDARYSTGKLVHLALYSFVSSSLVPLRLAGYLGIGITSLSGLLGIVVIVERYIFGDALNWAVSGSAQLAIMNVFLIGIVLGALGLIALYIENIHGEVSGRPLYVVRKKENF